jgi:dipeptidase D
MLLLSSLCLSTQAADGAAAQAALNSESTARILAVFSDISQVPRCSKDEARISAWLVDWARQRKLAVSADAHKNVLITVPASTGYESRSTVVLQAHMDMVCQKTADSRHDFSKDPIVLVRDGDWLRARDTTLGADNGIGIAIALALLQDSDSPHPKLEVLITTDEEIDMTGAGGVSRNLLSGKKFINLDSESEGFVTLGAAGGIKSEVTLPLARAVLPADQLVYSLQISGLLGGHSGIDINKGRANANVLIAQALAPSLLIRLIDFNGGSADNAITRAAQVRFALPKAQLDSLKAGLLAFEKATRAQYPTETALEIKLAPVELLGAAAYTLEDSAKALALVATLPQGVHEWSTEFKGLPETSNNLGVVKVENDKLIVSTFQRSFSPVKLAAVAVGIDARAASLGAINKPRSAFPTWPPNANSELYKKTLDAYQRQFKTAMKWEVLHAGLECGYIAEKFPDMEIISVGPTVQDVHTTKERLYLPSLGKLAQLLKEVLKTL